jgi:uncharacterized iron-regulated protein
MTRQDDRRTVRTVRAAAAPIAALLAAVLAGCTTTAAPADGAAPAAARAPYGPPRSRPVTPLPPRAPAPAAPAASTPATPAIPAALPADPQALADAMRGAPVVLLGEVHDNAAQHALRAAALERLIATGARPAIAFEQLDRERQPDVERARRERPRDADWLIAQAGGARGGWDWSLYRPFVQLALEHDLPIVAANLSRADASRVMREGYGAAFDAPTRTALGLDAVPPALLAAHEREVDVGHCGVMPAAMLAPMARAQLARDAALALAIAPHAVRGVVLLTGNGHARTDIGVPRWLPPELRAVTRSIGLLEGDGDAGIPGAAFDRVVSTPAAAREDPCAALRARTGPATQGR